MRPMSKSSSTSTLPITFSAENRGHHLSGAFRDIKCIPYEGVDWTKNMHVTQ